MEETGIDIGDLQSLKLEPREWTPPKGEQYSGEYYGVYFKVSSADFLMITNTAKDNLEQGFKAAKDIKNKKITKYSGIKEKYPGSPADNELESQFIWNLQKNWDDIEALKKSGNTNWFYYILENLKNKL